MLFLVSVVITVILRTLDPLDTNSRRIIQITTPSRTHLFPFSPASSLVPPPSRILRRRIRPIVFHFRYSVANVFATRIAIWNNPQAIGDGVSSWSALAPREIDSRLFFSFGDRAQTTTTSRSRAAPSGKDDTKSQIANLSHEPVACATIWIIISLGYERQFERKRKKVIVSEINYL